MATATSKKLYAKAIKLAATPEREFIELSNTLRKLREMSPDGFREFVKHSGFSRRKAFYLAQMDFSGATEAQQAQLQAMGWTKLALLGANPLVQNNNWSAVLYVLSQGIGGKPFTARETILVGLHADPNEKARCMTLYFTPAQYVVVEHVLLAHGAKKRGKGLSDKEVALVAALSAGLKS